MVFLRMSSGYEGFVSVPRYFCVSFRMRVIPSEIIHRNIRTFQVSGTDGRVMLR